MIAQSEQEYKQNVHFVVDKEKSLCYYRPTTGSLGEPAKEVEKVEMTIRGLVFSKFSSISEFANAIGWQRNKAARIVNQKQDPSKKDMEEMISVLEIPMSSVAPVFFGSMFTM